MPAPAASNLQRGHDTAAYLTQLLAQDPRNPYLHYRAGNFYARAAPPEADPDTARRHYAAAVAHHEGFGDAWNSWGLLDLVEAGKLRPRGGAAPANKADAVRRGELLHAAKAHFEKGVEATKAQTGFTYFSGLKNLSRVLAELGDIAGAIATLRTVVADDPNNAPALWNLAELLLSSLPLEEKKPLATVVVVAEVKSFLETAVAVDSTLVEAYVRLADVHQMTTPPNPALARATLEAAVAELERAGTGSNTTGGCTATAAKRHGLLLRVADITADSFRDWGRARATLVDRALPIAATKRQKADTAARLHRLDAAIAERDRQLAGVEVRAPEGAVVERTSLLCPAGHRMFRVARKPFMGLGSWACDVCYSALAPHVVVAAAGVDPASDPVLWCQHDCNSDLCRRCEEHFASGSMVFPSARVAGYAIARTLQRSTVADVAFDAPAGGGFKFYDLRQIDDDDDNATMGASTTSTVATTTAGGGGALFGTRQRALLKWYPRCDEQAAAATAAGAPPDDDVGLEAQVSGRLWGSEDSGAGSAAPGGGCVPSCGHHDLAARIARNLTTHSADAIVDALVSEQIIRCREARCDVAADGCAGIPAVTTVASEVTHNAIVIDGASAVCTLRHLLSGAPIPAPLLAALFATDYDCPMPARSIDISLEGLLKRAARGGGGGLALAHLPDALSRLLRHDLRTAVGALRRHYGIAPPPMTPLAVDDVLVGLTADGATLRFSIGNLGSFRPTTAADDDDADAAAVDALGIAVAEAGGGPRVDHGFAREVAACMSNPSSGVTLGQGSPSIAATEFLATWRLSDGSIDAALRRGRDAAMSSDVSHRIHCGESLLRRSLAPFAAAPTKRVAAADSRCWAARIECVREALVGFVGFFGDDGHDDADDGDDTRHSRRVLTAVLRAFQATAKAGMDTTAPKPSSENELRLPMPCRLAELTSTAACLAAAAARLRAYASTTARRGVVFAGSCVLSCTSSPSPAAEEDVAAVVFTISLAPSLRIVDASPDGGLKLGVVPLSCVRPAAASGDGGAALWSAALCHLARHVSEFAAACADDVEKDVPATPALHGAITLASAFAVVDGVDGILVSVVAGTPSIAVLAQATSEGPALCLSATATGGASCAGASPYEASFAAVVGPAADAWAIATSIANLAVAVAAASSSAVAPSRTWRPAAFPSVWVTSRATPRPLAVAADVLRCRVSQTVLRGDVAAAFKVDTTPATYAIAAVVDPPTAAAEDEVEATSSSSLLVGAVQALFVLEALDRGGPTGRSVVLAPDEVAWLEDRLPPPSSTSAATQTRSERHATAQTLLALVSHRRHAQLINTLRDPAAVAARRPLCLLYVEGYGDVLFYASVLRCVFGAAEGDRLWSTLRVQLNRYDVHTGEELVSGLREMALTSDELCRLRLFCIHDNDLQLLTAAAPGKRPGLFHHNDSNKGIQSCYHRLRFGRAIENYMTPVTMPLNMLKAQDPTLRRTLERMVTESLATVSKQFFAPFPKSPAAVPADATGLGAWLRAQAGSKRAEAERQSLLAGWAAPSRAAAATDPFWAGCAEFETRMGNALCPTPLHATALLRLRLAVARLLLGPPADASEAMRAFAAAQRATSCGEAAMADGAAAAETRAFIEATLQAHLLQGAAAAPPPPPLRIGDEVTLDEFAAFVRSNVGEAVARISGGGSSSTAKAVAGVRAKLLAATFFAFRTRAQQHDVAAGAGDEALLRLPELLRYVSTIATVATHHPAPLGGRGADADTVRVFVEACVSFLHGFTAAYFALFFPPPPPPSSFGTAGGGADDDDDAAVLARVAHQCTQLLQCAADAGGPPCRGLLLAWHPNASPDDCLAGVSNSFTRCVGCGREARDHHLHLTLLDDDADDESKLAAAALCLLSVAAFDSHPYLDAVRGEPCLGQCTAGSGGVDDGADALDTGLLELHDACLAPLRLDRDSSSTTSTKKAETEVGETTARWKAAPGGRSERSLLAADAAAADTMAVSLAPSSGRGDISGEDDYDSGPMRAVVAAVYFWRAEELRSIARSIAAFAR